MIQQPLSDLAVEIIRGAITDDSQEFVFAAQAGKPINRQAIATALRGRPDRNILASAKCLV